MAGGEVEQVGGRQADLHHVRAGERGPFGERGGEPGERRPHVVPDHDRAALGTGDGDERGPGAPDEVLVELVGDGAADVVGLEDGAHDVRVWAGHPRDSSAAPEGRRGEFSVSRW